LHGNDTRSFSGACGGEGGCWNVWEKLDIIDNKKNDMTDVRKVPVVDVDEGSIVDTSEGEGKNSGEDDETIDDGIFVPADDIVSTGSRNKSDNDIRTIPDCSAGVHIATGTAGVMINCYRKR
jgi:hypothetical protein